MENVKTVNTILDFPFAVKIIAIETRVAIEIYTGSIIGAKCTNLLQLKRTVERTIATEVKHFSYPFFLLDNKIK